MKKGTTLETSVNKTAYKKVKKPTVKEARLTEKIEKYTFPFYFSLSSCSGLL